MHKRKLKHRIMHLHGKSTTPWLSGQFEFSPPSIMTKNMAGVGMINLKVFSLMTEDDQESGLSKTASQLLEKTKT